MLSLQLQAQVEDIKEEEKMKRKGKRKEEKRKGKEKGKGKGKGKRRKTKIKKSNLEEVSMSFALQWQNTHDRASRHLLEIFSPHSPHPYKCWPLQLSKRCHNKCKGKICISSQAVQTLVFAHTEFPSAAPQGTVLCVLAYTEYVSYLLMGY